MDNSISIRLVDVNGSETTKIIAEGTRLSSLVSSEYAANVNGQAVGRDMELRAGDVVEVVRKSGKLG
jgi:sulfur carrier protein ThiS